MSSAPTDFLDASGVFGSCVPGPSGSSPSPLSPERLPSVTAATVDVCPLPPRHLPPIGNTGVTYTTNKDGCQSVDLFPVQCRASTGHVVDWLGVTIFELLGDERDVMAWLTPDDSKMGDWFEVSGKNGYRRGWRRGALVFWYEGRGGMGVHVSLSGEGCRQLEEENGLDEAGWLSFLLAIRACRLGGGMNVSRLDIAKDDKTGILSMPIINDKVVNGHVSSGFRSWSHTMKREGSLGEVYVPAPGDDAETLYLGKRSSDMYVKIYNKHLERLDKGFEGSETGHWVRVEATFKDGSADKLLDMLALARTFDVVGAWLQQKIVFKEPCADDSNKSRWESCGWWSEFFDFVPKLVRSVGDKAAKTLDDAKGWVRRQVAPLLAVIADVLYLDAKAKNVTPRSLYWGYFSELLEYGRTRYKDKHRAMVSENAPRSCVLAL